MTPTQENVLLVLDRIKEQVSKDAQDAEVYAEQLESMLADLHSDDFFGSEGQSDPRGDFRNGGWSMWEVEK